MSLNVDPENPEPEEQLKALRYIWLNDDSPRSYEVMAERIERLLRIVADQTSTIAGLREEREGR